MLPGQARRRKHRSFHSEVEDKATGNVKTEVKVRPFPEVTGRFLHSPHPLKEINTDQSTVFSKLKMELSFADLEEGTSALSTPSSSFAASKFSRPKYLQNEALAGLNLLPYLESSVDRGSERHFKHKTLEEDRSVGLKPTDVLALEKKMTPDTGCAGNTAGGSSTVGDRSMAELKDPPSSLQQDTEVDVAQEGDVAQPSAHVRGVWNSVVSWIKTAVDFVSKDTTAEAEPIDRTTTTTTKGKKRKLVDPDFSDSPTSKQPRATATLTVPSHGQGTSNHRGRGRRRKSLAAAKGQEVAVSHSEGSRWKSSCDMKSSASPRLPSSPISSIVSESSSSPVLATVLSERLATAVPPMATTSTAQQISSSMMKWKPAHLEASQSGLNSILDDSAYPLPKKIKRQSLRTYYGNSVNSPNLTEVPATAITIRRSPRLHASSKIPAPPPPPPIPAAPPPPAPRVPPFVPPPPHPCNSSVLTSTPSMLNSPALQSTGGVDPSRNMLSQMQSRLRSRIKKKGRERECSKSGGTISAIDGRSLDIKEKQWAEIQAHRRKVPLEEFLTHANEKKEELKKVLFELDQHLPATFKGIVEVVDLLQDGAQWFPGGSKDMRESLPLYKKLERKLETLTEYVHVCSEMREATLLQLSPVVVCQHGMLHTSLHQLKEEFEARHRHWGTIMASKAQSWTSISLPVCQSLLSRSSDHMCTVVQRYISLCLEEAGQLKGALLAMKCMKTSKLKEALKGCLSFLSESSIYFCHDHSLQCPAECHFCPTLPESPASTSTSCGGCAAGSASGSHYEQSQLVSLMVDVLLAYVEVALGQCDGFILRSSRQAVCEHFEGILKLMGIAKSVLCTVFSTKANSVRNSGGYLQLLPDSDKLGHALYTCCEKLVQHIMNTAKPMESGATSPSSEEKLSKEVVLWMMFGCKYIHQSLEFLGTEHAQKMGLVKLLQQLQHMEDLL